MTCKTLIRIINFPNTEVVKNGQNLHKCLMNHMHNHQIKERVPTPILTIKKRVQINKGITPWIREDPMISLDDLWQLFFI